MTLAPFLRQRRTHLSAQDVKYSTRSANFKILGSNYNLTNQTNKIKKRNECNFGLCSHDVKRLYDDLKSVEPRPPIPHPSSVKTGHIYQQRRDKIKERWAGYFNQVLNRPVVINRVIPSGNPLGVPLASGKENPG